MTKKEIILQSALTLFASQGYDSTSTSKIAKHAKVSEGLIFRHFENKEGLLEAVMQLGLSKANSSFEIVLNQKDAKKRIKAAITLPFEIDKSDYPFWKLMYTLKWQRGSYNTEAFNAFRVSLEDAFSALNYNQPKEEARLIEILIDGLATEVLLKEQDPTALLNIILNKYNLK